MIHAGQLCARRLELSEDFGGLLISVSDLVKAAPIIQRMRGNLLQEETDPDVLAELSESPCEVL